MPAAPARAIDVVSVPDFAGKAAPKFVIRSLYFLASWIEFAGAARRFPLHLACIGTPPDSVLWLAEQAGARVSTHDPGDADGGAGVFANKLRGLEVAARTEDVLLLDTDVLILSDLSSFASLGRCIAAAPSLKPKVAEREWLAIYRALGLAPPDERIACVHAELDLPRLPHLQYPEQNDEMRRMIPYFNAGVIFAPWDCNLRQAWEGNVRRIADLFRADPDARPALVACDQAGLALSIELLKRDGVPFRRLRPSHHATFYHLYRNRPPLGEVHILHALQFGREADTSDFFPRVHRNFIRGRLHGLHDLLRTELHEKPFAAPDLLRRYWSARRSTHRLGAILERLYHTRVAPALEAGGWAPAPAVFAAGWPRVPAAVAQVPRAA